MTATASTGSAFDPSEKFYTPIEVGAQLGFSKATIIRWLKDESHPLCGVKINNLWRISESSLKEYLEGEFNANQ